MADILAYRPAFGSQRNGHHRHAGLCVGVWSDYIITYTMIDRDAQMTISVGIKKVFATSYESALSPRFRNQFAGEAADATMLLFSALPVMIIYALMQKWFMRGLTEGAIKF